MLGSRGQGDLFKSAESSGGHQPEVELPLQREQLRDWQQRLHHHQAPLFRGEPGPSQQGSLFGDVSQEPVTAIRPLALAPLPLSFWRWPESPHRGAAIYLVLDRPADLEQPLLLYVGETKAADQRWKGEHDCKTYLAAYGEALQRCGISHQFSIRFCTDVPQATRARRELEQQLIRHWLPPFNKETRQRWPTPFTSDIDN